LISKMQFDNLQHEVYVIATSLRNEFQMPITDTELSVLFGHTGGWANGIITRHLQHLTSDKPIARGRPKSVQAEAERRLIQFCLTWQREKNHVTIHAAIDFMTQNGTQINQFWINRLVKRNNNVITIQTANLLEKRHNLSEGDLRDYFDTVSIQLKKVPPLFVWNADGTRVGIPK
jgi:hypothetical protein